MHTTKTFILVAILLAVSILPACKQSKVHPVDPVERVEVSLNVTALQKNMSLRINNILAERQDALAAKSKEPVEDILIGSESIVIKEVFPVMAGETVLFGVKLKVNGVAKYGLAEDVAFTTDSTGSLVMPFVGALATGKDVVFAGRETAPVAAGPGRIPAELSSEVFKGTGKSEVVFLTDPFCHYCRLGYDFLSDNMNMVGSFRVAHMPNLRRPGADAATWVLCYAMDNGLDVKKYFDFAYRTLEKPVAKTTKAAGILVVGQYQKQFPNLYNGSAEDFYKELSSKYARKVAASVKALNDFGFKATPFFQINGNTVRGFNPKELAKLLKGSNDAN